MNILYLDQYAGSLKHGRSFRPQYLGQQWQEKGHKLVVVGGSYSHLRSKQPSKKIEFIDGITYVWLKTPKYDGNGIKRALSIIIFMMQLFFNIRYILKLSKPDIIITSSVHMMDIFPGWLMKKLSKAKNLVFELHDLWPMTLIELGKMSKYHPFVLMITLSEYCTYKLSDKIVSMLPFTYKHLKKFGIKKKQFIHIPNGIVLDDWHKAEDLPKDLKAKLVKLHGKFIVAYAGSHAISNQLNTLLETAKLCQDSDIVFFLLGDGQEKKNLENMAKTLKLKNVIFHGKINKKSIPNFLNKIDVCYIGTQNQKIYQYGLSCNKLFDYMMAEKPIIFSSSTSKNTVTESKCGYSVKANNPKLVLDAIEKLKKMDSSERKKLGILGKNAVLHNHEYIKLADRFLKFISS